VLFETSLFETAKRFFAVGLQTTVHYSLLFPGKAKVIYRIKKQRTINYLFHQLP